jgi:hypothetical protein
LPQATRTSGVCRVGFLNQRAEQTCVIWQFALQYLAAKIDVTEQAFERISQLLKGRGSEESFRRRSPKGGGGKREFVLAFEVMKKAAFGHARLVPDVINCGRRVTLGPDDVQRRVQELCFRNMLYWGCHRRVHTTSGYAVKAKSRSSFFSPARSLRLYGRRPPVRERAGRFKPFATGLAGISNKGATRGDPRKPPQLTARGRINH